MRETESSGRVVAAFFAPLGPAVAGRGRPGRGRGTGDRSLRYAGMRRSFRPPVKARRERRRFVRRERDDEVGEQDTILDLGGDEKQASVGSTAA